MNIINIVLSSIITYISIVFSVNNIVKQKLNYKAFFKYFAIMLILVSIIYLNFDGIIRLVLNIFLITILLYVLMFNRDISKSIYYSIVYELIAFVGEIVLSILFVAIFNFDMKSYESFSFSLLIFTICNSLLTYLITKVGFVGRFVIKVDKKISKNNKYCFYVISVIALLIMLISYNKFNLKLNLNFFINIFLFIFVLVSFIYVIYNKLKKDKLESNYIEMMEYVQKYEKIINEQGKKNHEYNNQLMVIKGYIGNKKKLEEYLDLIINEHKCGQNYTIRELSYFPDGGIKGLIYHKISKMEDNNIKYYIYVDKNIKNIFEDKLDIKTYQDITKLLGIFLDNAIDATITAQIKEIEIDIKKDDNYVIITISNTFNLNIDINQIGKKGFTTKGIGHGYGLSIVKDINKHNEMIETFNDLEDDKFKQIIMLYYENKK